MRPKWSPNEAQNGPGGVRNLGLKTGCEKVICVHRFGVTFGSHFGIENYKKREPETRQFLIPNKCNTRAQKLKNGSQNGSQNGGKNKVEIVTKSVAKIEQQLCQKERENERLAHRKRCSHAGPVRFLQTRPVPEYVENIQKKEPKWRSNLFEIRVKSGSRNGSNK